MFAIFINRVQLCSQLVLRALFTQSLTHPWKREELVIHFLFGEVCPTKNDNIDILHAQPQTEIGEEVELYE